MLEVGARLESEVDAVEKVAVGHGRGTTSGVSGRPLAPPSHAVQCRYSTSDRSEEEEKMMRIVRVIVENFSCLPPTPPVRAWRRDEQDTRHATRSELSSIFLILPLSTLNLASHTQQHFLLLVVLPRGIRSPRRPRRWISSRARCVPAVAVSLSIIHRRPLRVPEQSS